ncbi:MAG: nucleotide exchange factor GrpE [Ruminococcaceae bacterium]|nr:nucleotide exchange factor GrpE [Oscillospiraceae bacterium]
MKKEEKIECEQSVDTAQLDEANKRAEEAEAKYAEANDKFLRTLAEYDNFRKRTAKERDGIYADAYMDAIKSILPVIDNIERITAFASDEKMGEGINLIIASMKETLNKMGVTEIEAKTFDPNFHNAVMHIDDESLGEGEIVEVFQKGYLYGDRVIRYAMVKVAN